MKRLLARFCALAALITPALLNAFGVAPQANAIPFVALSPASPHTSWSGNPVTLKGTLTSTAWGTDSFTYDWNPGDGVSPHCTGAVTNPYVIGCPVTYTGAVGTLYTAVLTITDTTNGLISPPSNCPPAITQGACYYTALEAPPPNLPVEVNSAIDNGLWYLHSSMLRTTAADGAPIGNWYGAGGNANSAGAGGTGVDALNCAAFEDSGFLQTNIPSNPYADDVRLCLNGVFDQLSTIPISTQTDVTFGTFNPDQNGNGIGVGHNGYPENYQTGMMLDAVVASGTPNTLVTAGTNLGVAAVGKGSGAGQAYLYKDAVYDMVDDYVYCQAQTEYDVASSWVFETTGGWHYSCQEETGDNSVSQWAAIGIIPALRNFGATVPAELHEADDAWLDNSFTKNSAVNGYFGYTSSSTLWGPYADTPSGMVQLAMNGLGQGKTTPGGNAAWDSAATFLRDGFANQGDGATGDLKDYYYGMFSFTKAMLLHDNSGTGLSNTPLSTLQSLDDPHTCASPVPLSSIGSGAGPCYPPIDWYAAQTAAYGGSDPTNGVARTLVASQGGDGSWYGHNYTGQQYYMETASAIIMLNKTVFQPVPVACFTANPSHVASGGPVTLNGQCSVDQNPSFSLVSWQWDVDGTGGTNFTIGPGSPQCLTKSCSEIIYNFTLPGGKSLPYNYPVRLRVTDNATPTPLTADVVGNVVIASPPNPPNANAGGPYNFCPNTTVGGAVIYSPFTLDGSKSTNPDQGKTDSTPGAPPSTIVSYLWDYSCSGAFTSASGVQVNATTAFDQAAFFGSSFNVCLQVTNNDNLAFPTAKLAAGLSSVASAQVTIHQPTDEACSHCVNTLGGSAKAPTPGVAGNIQLYWTDTDTSIFPIDHYNIYRSTSSTFVPFAQIAGAASSPFVPAVQVSVPAGGTLHFLDANVVGGTTYYYRVAPATANDTETCQGNVTITVAIARGR
jgi:hypothetical protein